jgi:hypothetical protein
VWTHPVNGSRGGGGKWVRALARAERAAWELRGQSIVR